MFYGTVSWANLTDAGRQAASGLLEILFIYLSVPPAQPIECTGGQTCLQSAGSLSF